MWEGQLETRQVQMRLSARHRSGKSPEGPYQSWTPPSSYHPGSSGGKHLNIPGTVKDTVSYVSCDLARHASGFVFLVDDGEYDRGVRYRSDSPSAV